MSDFRKTLNEIVDLKNGKKPLDFDDFRASTQLPSKSVNLKKTIEFNPTNLKKTIDFSSNATLSFLNANFHTLNTDDSPRTLIKSQYFKRTLPSNYVDVASTNSKAMTSFVNKPR